MSPCTACVFVPASQTGLPREAAMSELVGQTVRLKITEVNRGRKRVVGSIRAVANRERKERAEKIWNEIDWLVTNRMPLIMSR